MKKLLAMTLGLMVWSSLHAADLFYKKNLSLYVMHDLEKGQSESQQLDTPVGAYIADGGAVAYVKGQTLYVITDTHDPKPMKLESAVTDFKLKDGLIAYIKGDSLYVRRLSDDSSVASRRVPESLGVSSLDVAGGSVIFIKNVNTLYRVTDLDSGGAERVIYPVGEVQISGR